MRVRPFQGNFKNNIEIFNESLTLLSSYFIFLWLYDGGLNPEANMIYQQKQFENNFMPWIFICVVSLVILVNISF